MRVTILGSGSAFNADRNPSGYVVELGGSLVLLDLGFGNLRRLARAKLDVARVSDVFFSHRHPDHVGDLAALLFHRRYNPPAEGVPLRIWGPRDFSTFARRLQDAYEPWCAARDVELHDLSSGELIRRDGWTLETLSVPHPTPALAYRLSYKGKSLVYSGDTAFSPALADFAAETDLFLLECASSERKPAEGHMTPRVALATLEASRCRKGVLTHLSEGALAELARLPRRRGVTLARDLQSFDI